MIRQSGLIVWLLAAAVALLAAPSSAQQVCLQLESQLAALERQNPETVYQNLLAQYSRARETYDRSYAQAQQLGCIRFFRFQIPDSCDPLLAQLNTQLTQVNGLERELQAVNRNQTNAARLNILRALAANNCGPQYAQYANQGGGGLLDRLFALPQPGLAIGDGLIPLVTTYRTICVRACDGYYFPISFSTTTARFDADQRTCETQCPGATLYYHENPGAPVETAVSLDGRPYTNLENAFAYRNAYYPQCGCQPATMIVAVKDPPFTPIGADTVDRIAAVVVAIPLPQQRPEPTEDPETIANRLGHFTPGTFAIGNEDYTALLVTDEGQRLIGPAYLYVQ
ncbi:MAG: DUF2865 domain-containing protein [Alphaproteobacteria bacterium]